jgi:hypothetical protein
MFRNGSLFLSQQPQHPSFGYNLRRRPLVEFSPNTERANIILNKPSDKPKAATTTAKKTRVQATAMARKESNKKKKSVGRPQKRKAAAVKGNAKAKGKAKTKGRKRIRVTNGAISLKMPGSGMQKFQASQVLRHMPLGLVRKVAKKIWKQTAEGKTKNKRRQQTRKSSKKKKGVSSR